MNTYDIIEVIEEDDEIKLCKVKTKYDTKYILINKQNDQLVVEANNSESLLMFFD